MSRIAKALGAIRGPAALVFLTCLLGWTLTNMDQSLFGYAIPGIRAEFGAGIDDVGWVLSASFLFAALAAAAIGALTDRYGRKFMFALCLSLSAVLVGLHALVAGLVTLTLLRMLSVGLSNGLAPITAAYTAEAAPAEARGLLLGLMNCGYPLGWFVASLFVAPMLASFGWRLIFLPALLVIPVALILTRFLPESARFVAARAAAPDRRPLLAKVAELFAPDLRRKTLTCFACCFLFGGAYAGTAFYLPTYFQEFRGYTTEQAAAIVGNSYGVGLVGYVAVSFMAEFVSTRRNVCILWSLLGSGAVVGLMWSASSYAGDVIWFALMAGFLFGSAAAIGAMVAEIFPTRVRATAYGLAGSCALNLGHATFPVLVAWGIKTVGWQWAFTLGVVPPMVLVALGLLTLDNVRSGVDLDEIAT
jgi:MFS family permease